jgi:hypothetical protein
MIEWAGGVPDYAGVGSRLNGSSWTQNPLALTPDHIRNLATSSFRSPGPNSPRCSSAITYRQRNAAVCRRVRICNLIWCPVSAPPAQADTPIARVVLGRFGVTRYLPAILLELQAWLWLPSVGHQLRPADRVSQFEHLSFAAALILLVGLYIIAMFLQPALASFRRFLEGVWPVTFPWRSLASWRVEYYYRVSQELRHRLEAVEQSESQQPSASKRDQQRSPRRRRDREARYRYDYSRIRDFPPEPAAPTRLGNVLGAAEARVNGRYGLSPSLVFPRLYSLLPSNYRGVLDDARFQVEVKEDYCTSFLAASLFSVLVIVVHYKTFSAGWLFLAAFNYLLAYQAYRGAIAAARTYVQYFESAFDLYRFELYKALLIPLPKTAEEEKNAASIANNLAEKSHLSGDLSYAYPFDSTIQLESIATTMDEVLERRIAGPRLDAFHGYVSVRVQLTDGDAEFRDDSFIVASSNVDGLRVIVTMSTMRPAGNQLVERIDIDGEEGKAETIFSILPDIDGGIVIPLQASVTVPTDNGQVDTQFDIEGIMSTESHEAFVEVLQKNRNVTVLRFLVVLRQGSL